MTRFPAIEWIPGDTCRLVRMDHDFRPWYIRTDGRDTNIEVQGDLPVRSRPGRENAQTRACDPVRQASCPGPTAAAESGRGLAGSHEGPYERIAPHLPVQRGNVTHSNQQVLNAILYVAEHGCKWRGLPARFGNWHTIYTPDESLVEERGAGPGFRTPAARTDRAHQARGGVDGQHHRQGPSRRDGCAKKNGPQSIGKIPRRLDHQDSYGCRGCSNRHHVLALAGTGPRRPGRTQAAESPWSAAR